MRRRNPSTPVGGVGGRSYATPDVPMGHDGFRKWGSMMGYHPVWIIALCMALPHAATADEAVEESAPDVVEQSDDTSATDEETVDSMEPGEAVVPLRDPEFHGGAPAPFYRTWQDKLAGRIRVGLRYTYIELRDKDRSSPRERNYLGSIDKLNTRQADFPSPVISYSITDHFSVLLSYDWVSARTVKTETRNNSHTDGIIFLEGPVLAMRVEYPLDGRFTPYAELGIVFYFSSFDHDFEWAHVGAHRRMRLNDPTGLMLSSGVDIAVKDHWSAQLYLRYADVETKGSYYLNRELREESKFPLSNYGAGAGVAYAF